MNRRSWGIAWAALVVVAAGALVLGTGTGAAAKHRKTRKKAAAVTFCPNPVDNYLAPLEELQRLPAVPEGGVLRFAPEGVTLAATGPQGLLVGGSNVGFRLTNAAPAGAATPTLHWTVLERLTRLTDNGRRPHPEGLKRIDLARLPAGKHRGLTFPVAAKPAIYSLEVTIQNHRGRLLGRYGEYIRVVARTVSAGLTLAAYDKVVPGSYIESCFEDRGTAAITPTTTRLERFDGTIWRPVVVGPQYVTAASAPRTLFAGESEPVATLVPPDAKPGLYKLTAFGTTDAAEPVYLTAEFGVL